MTAQDRERVKQAIDRRVRMLLADDRSEAVCSRCGVELAGRTRGCDTCTARHANWRKRTAAAHRAGGLLA